MARKTTPPGRQDRVTLREFRTIFNKVVPRPFFDRLYDEVAETFPSKKSDASVTVKQFLKNVDSVLDIKKGQKLDLTKKHHYGAETLLKVMGRMPTLQKEFAKQQAVAEDRSRRKKAAARNRDRQAERIETLARDVASLRQQVNSRPPSAEEEARTRQWYEDHDTRIGGDRNPGKWPGLRD